MTIPLDRLEQACLRWQETQSTGEWATADGARSMASFIREDALKAAPSDELTALRNDTQRYVARIAQLEGVLVEKGIPVPPPDESVTRWETM